MFIRHFSFESNVGRLNISRINFERQNLLVGVSGAGKTQILASLKKIAHFVKYGASTESFNAQIGFRLTDGDYDYQIETTPNKNFAATITKEVLQKEGKIVFDRKDVKINLEGVEHRADVLLPTLPLIPFLKTPQTEHIKAEFDKLVFYDFDKEIQNSIQNNNAPQSLLNRFYALQQTDKRAFEEIKQVFLSLFKGVNDIRFDYAVNDFAKTKLLLQIKEGNTWISASDTSLGMLKTLCHLVNLVLLESGSVVVFDELENSLGVNCLDFVVQELLQNRDDVQFIFTSHHPYIINNIPPSLWHIISREGTEVFCKKAADYNITDQTPDAFYQLINKIRFYE